MPEDCVGYPVTSVKGDCKLWFRFLEPNSGPLQEHQVVLIIELLLQPQTGNLLIPSVAWATKMTCKKLYCFRRPLKLS